MKRRRHLHSEQLESRLALSANPLCFPDTILPSDMIATPTSPPETVQVGDEFPTTQPVLFQEVEYFGGRADWNVNSIQAPEVWNAGFTGEGITVAVIDTGVDLTHPDLVDNLWTNVGEIAGDGIDNDGNGFVDDVFGWDFVSHDASPNDAHGHGTHVAGTIAAGNNGRGTTGIAYGADIMPIRVLGNDGSGSSLDVAAGIRYAVDNGADVINLSLGGGYSSTIDAALQYAEANDVFVVAASGNEGQSEASHPARLSANLNNVISVGAHNSSSRTAPFSNQPGSGVIQVDAPGVQIHSTVPNHGYATFSGTSMAAPHVAGVAALALSANPSLSAEQLRNVMVAGADMRVDGSSAIGGVDANQVVSRAFVGDFSEALERDRSRVEQNDAIFQPADESRMTAGILFEIQEGNAKESARMPHADVIDRIFLQASDQSVAFDIRAIDKVPEFAHK